MAHNDGRDWSWRGGYVIFEQFVANPIIPDSSLIGRQITFNGVVVKLIDERTCLFRRETRSFERQGAAPLILIGEIHFGPEGYLVIGRLPGEPGDQVGASLVLILLFAMLLSQFKDLFTLLGLTLLFIFLAGMFFHLFTLERYNLRKAYPKVIDRVQSRNE